MLCHWSKLIALLPLEEWQEALNRAETIAVIRDPTLFMQYLHSDKPKILKSIIEAAIPLKEAVLKAQTEIRAKGFTGDPGQDIFKFNKG